MKNTDNNSLSSSLLELSIQAQELERRAASAYELEDLRAKISEKDVLINKLKAKISELEVVNTELEAKSKHYSFEAPTNIKYPDNVIYSFLEKLYLHVPESQVALFSSEMSRFLLLHPGLPNDRAVLSLIQGSIIQDALILVEKVKDGIECNDLEFHTSPFSDQKSLLANRFCLFLTLKNMSLDNLYKMLSVGLFYGNIRAVSTIKDALFAKMLDLQLPCDIESLKHPVLWAFGANYSTKLALNYLHSLLFNLVKVPSDPKTGDNLWHYIAKDTSNSFVTNIKNCSAHTNAIELPNKQGVAPFHLVSPNSRLEVLQCIIMNMATEAAECYKIGDYAKALDLYSKALDKQISLSCEYTDKINDKHKLSHNTNIGKLLYNKARSLMRLKRWCESITTCELCIAYIPNYGNAYETIIQAAESLLDWERGMEACIEYQNACGVDPVDKREFFTAQLNATAFQILQIPANSSPKIIKQSFNNLCKLWHPDKIHENEDLKRRSTIHFNRLFNARQLLLNDDTLIIEQMKGETNYFYPDPIFKSKEDRPTVVDKITRLHFDVLMQMQFVGLLEMAGNSNANEIDEANSILTNLQAILVEASKSVNDAKKASESCDVVYFPENLRKTHLVYPNDDVLHRVESSNNDEENSFHSSPPSTFQNSTTSQTYDSFSRFMNTSTGGFDSTLAPPVIDSWATSMSNNNVGAANFDPFNIYETGQFKNSDTTYTGNNNQNKYGNTLTSKIRPLGFRMYTSTDI